MDRDDMVEAVVQAFAAWVKTTDHMYGCIGYSEGQGCCIDPSDPQEPESEYGGRGRKLAEMAVDAILALTSSEGDA